MYTLSTKLFNLYYAFHIYSIHQMVLDACETGQNREANAQVKGEM